MNAGEKVRIRTVHPDGFRSGEWATLRGTTALPVPGSPERDCYLVEFDDGVTDFWVVADPDGRYEFSGSGACG